MNKEDIFQLLIRHCKEILPELQEHDFKYENQLKELGANSIDRAEITMMSMESLSLQIPRTELVSVKNLGELVDVFFKYHQQIN